MLQNLLENTTSKSLFRNVASLDLNIVLDIFCKRLPQKDKNGLDAKVCINNFKNVYGKSKSFEHSLKFKENSQKI